jgi:glutamate N-acetyltransferase/amino-acid N-acetyltransferase
MIREVDGGVTAAKGFRAAGVHCGVKKEKKDLALILSDVPAVGAGVLTRNIVAAAPVVLDRELLASSPAFRAIVVNSGNANACTGEPGMADARRMGVRTAAALGLVPAEVLVSSTGVIGRRLPIERITEGIAGAAPLLSPGGHRDAAEAIMTTDTFPKEAAAAIVIDGITVTIGGMAKGSGMIAPNMATLLAFVTTDARIAPPLLTRALKQAADRSFNRITVDGDTSTNDMVLLLANGCAGNKELSAAPDPGYEAFCAALEDVMRRLSKMIVTDGEGATKFVEIRVTGARNDADADRAARAIANSSLVKTALHGEDANWGRILAAVGYSGIAFDPAETSIDFGDLPVLRRQFGIDFSEERAKEVLGRKEIAVTVNLHQGGGEAFVWTCDLSAEYVAINANYRT